MQECIAEPFVVVKTKNAKGKVFINICLNDVIPTDRIVTIGKEFTRVTDVSGNLSFAYDVVVSPEDINDDDDLQEVCSFPFHKYLLST